MRDRIKKILKENDFDWTNDVNPTSKEDIVKKIYNLRDVGYRRDPEISKLTEIVYNLALSQGQFEKLFEALYHLAEYSYSEGIDIGNQQGYSEGERDGYRYGYDEGLSDVKQDITEELELEREKGYDEGYGEGLSEGYTKGYEEGKEETYHKAFEEGRAYEAGLEVEDLERRESGFDPSEYYDEEDKNY